MYLVYLIRLGNYSYVGMTNDFFHRWRQHNKEIKGGAKYTTRCIEKKNDCQKTEDMWYPILIIDGFKTMKEAMQCEWKLKRRKGHLNRVRWSHELLTNHDRWTSKSPLIKDQRLHVYIDDDYRHLFKDYETRQLYWKI